jgi:hypothetical protein
MVRGKLERTPSGLGLSFPRVEPGLGDELMLISSGQSVRNNCSGQAPASNGEAWKAGRFSLAIISLAVCHAYDLTQSHRQGEQLSQGLLAYLLVLRLLVVHVRECRVVFPHMCRAYLWDRIVELVAPSQLDGSSWTRWKSVIACRLPCKDLLQCNSGVVAETGAPALSSGSDFHTSSRWIDVVFLHKLTDPPYYVATYYSIRDQNRARSGRSRLW